MAFHLKYLLFIEKKCHSINTNGGFKTAAQKNKISYPSSKTMPLVLKKN